jgi:hypothetical protein
MTDSQPLTRAHAILRFQAAIIREINADNMARGPIDMGRDRNALYRMITEHRLLMHQAGLACEALDKLIPPDESGQS